VLISQCNQSHLLTVALSEARKLLLAQIIDPSLREANQSPKETKHADTEDDAQPVTLLDETHENEDKGGEIEQKQTE
jgi:hypothetical protein